MAFSCKNILKTTTALELLLEEINFQRTKEMRQLLKEDSGFIMLQGATYWTDLFVRHFLFQTDRSTDSDDLLFFVRKKHIKTSSKHVPKFETNVDVFRKDSRKLPIGDPDIDWEETVYLNLIIHQFEYTLTLAICTRTSPKELQVLKRHSQKVYASPSRRRMDTKGEVEEMTYPHICFMVDNYDEVFCDILVRDGEMVCVELVASDHEGVIQAVIFLGSIRYDALKKVYDARQSSLSTKMAQRMTFGLFSTSAAQRCEFVRMKGPQGKGHAEMAVTKPKGSGVETPTSEPGYCMTDAYDNGWDSDPEEYFSNKHQRRSSDPSSNLNNFVRGGWKSRGTSSDAPFDGLGARARSENEGLDILEATITEIEAGDVKDDLRMTCHHRASNKAYKNTASCSRNEIGAWDKKHKTKLKANEEKENDEAEAVECEGKGNETEASTNNKDDNNPDIQRANEKEPTLDGYWPHFQHSTPDEKECCCWRRYNRHDSLSSMSDVYNKTEKCHTQLTFKNLLSQIELADDATPKRCAEIAAKDNCNAVTIMPMLSSRDDFEFADDAISYDNDRLSRHVSLCSLDNVQPSPQLIINVSGKEELPCVEHLSKLSKMSKSRNVTVAKSVVSKELEKKLSPTMTKTSKCKTLESVVRDTSDRNGNSRIIEAVLKRTHSLPRSKDCKKWPSIRPPHMITPDGTDIYYWCDLKKTELDDGQYNPLWTMRGNMQSFHFWKENKRAQSIPLNAFLTYITLPWWSIAKDILDHREDPILTF